MIAAIGVSLKRSGARLGLETYSEVITAGLSCTGLGGATTIRIARHRYKKRWRHYPDD